MPKAQGDALLQTYTSVSGPAVPPTAPFAAVVRAGQTLQQYVPLPRGTYTLLLDHSAALGQVAPPLVGLDDRAARLDYLIQVGSRP